MDLNGQREDLVILGADGYQPAETGCLLISEPSEIALGGVVGCPEQEGLVLRRQNQGAEVAGPSEDKLPPVRRNLLKPDVRQRDDFERQDSAVLEVGEIHGARAWV